MRPNKAKEQPSSVGRQEVKVKDAEISDSGGSNLGRSRGPRWSEWQEPTCHAGDLGSGPEPVNTPLKGMATVGMFFYGNAMDREVWGYESISSRVDTTHGVNNKGSVWARVNCECRTWAIDDYFPRDASHPTRQ